MYTEVIQPTIKMAVDPLTATLIIGAASTLIGGWVANRQAKKNRDQQASTNTANTQASWDMYYRQRDDAREDWQAMNAYNHPIAQMNRLRQAGLNPHLVYGKGADNTAAMVKNYGGNVHKQEAPQYDTNALQSMFDAPQTATSAILNARQVQAQTDNLHEQNALIIKQGLLTDAKTAETIQDTARSKYDLELAQEMKDDIIEAMKLKNQKTWADIQFTLDENQRKELMTAPNLEIAQAKLENIIQDTMNKKIEKAKTQQEKDNLEVLKTKLLNEGIIAEAQAKLWQKNINPNDPAYIRILQKIIEEAAKMMGIDIGQ